LSDAGCHTSDALEACRQQLAEAERLLAESRTREAETAVKCERYRRLSDATLECVVLHDKGRIIDCNLASEGLFGLPRDQILGTYALDFAPPEARETILANILAGREEPYEALGQRRGDGHIFPTELYGRQIEYDGRVVRVTVIRDITERKQAEAALMASRDLNRRILEAVPGGVVEVNLQGQITAANGESLLLLGLSLEQIKQLCIHDFNSCIFEDGTLCSSLDFPVARCLATGEAQPEMVLGVPKPDGTVLWAMFSAIPMRDPTGSTLAGVVVTFVDITRRKKFEDQLQRVQHELEIRVEERTAELSEANRLLTLEIAERRHAEQELQADQQLLRHLLAAHERNQKLTAYEIHDGLVQDVTAALMHLESLEDKLPAFAWKAAEIPLRLLRRAIGEGRRLISGLRPPIIDEQGVVAAIEYLVGEEQLAGQLAISLEIDVRFDRLEPLLESAIFRIVQESLANIRQHSKSPRAALSIRQSDHSVEILIEDWGIGFDPSQVTKQRFGVRGIRERARLLGGKTTIESRPGEGTRVRVNLPVSS